MKKCYVLLALSIMLIQPIYSKKRSNRTSSQSVSANEKKVRGELEKLIKKNRADLTFKETRRIDELINQLAMFSPEDAGSIKDSLYATCCCLSEFERHEIRAEVDDLFKKPNKQDARWVARVDELLNRLYNGINGNFSMGCSGDYTREELLEPYNRLAHEYEKIMGKKHEPEITYC